jgi:hypothetical protein
MISSSCLKFFNKIKLSRGLNVAFNDVMVKLLTSRLFILLVAIGLCFNIGATSVYAANSVNSNNQSQSTLLYNIKITWSLLGQLSKVINEEHYLKTDQVPAQLNYNVIINRLYFILSEQRNTLVKIRLYSFLYKSLDDIKLKIENSRKNPTDLKAKQILKKSLITYLEKGKRYAKFFL